MKKFLLRILTVVLSVILITASVTSCGLFETNTDRDMAQVVATVDIDGDGGVETESIYKRELISGFMSYGYMYVQSYGYTTAQTYELILDNLINNKIILQNAKKKLAGAENTDALLDSINAYSETALALFATQAEVEDFESKNKNLESGKEDYLKGLAKYVDSKYRGKKVTANDAPFRFVEEQDIWKALETMKDSANSLIKSFLDEEEDHEHETLSYTIRTTPDKGEEDEEDLTAEEIADIQKKELKLDGGNATVNALNEAYERFVDLGLIDSSEKFDADIKDVKARDVSILSLSYFKSAIKSELENAIIVSYEEVLREETKLNATDDAESLWSAYLELKSANENEYDGDVSAMETALGAVSDSSFVAYVEGEGYVYVSHLLVKFNDDANAVLEEKLVGNYKAEDVANAVKDAVQKIEATDLRSSWVQAGYGVLENGKVKFKDDYVYDNAFELAYFDGEIEKIYAHSEENEDGQKILSFNYYGVTGNKKSYSEFLDLTARVLGVNSVEYGVKGKIADGSFETVNNRFEDLKFAYSEDEGNFNNYFGYLYSPVTSDNQFVSAFAEAAKDVSLDGVGAYKVFGSKEYGLHVVLCTKTVAELIYANDDDGKAKFIADLSLEDTVAFNYLEATNALLESNYISKLADKFVQDGLSKEGCVVRFEKTYADLVEEAE
ncbi:MAG: hypothetical protein IJW64_06190 [Clostridia bacterium]|nr:hypothetical protein [Clostridia bacterium]